MTRTYEPEEIVAVEDFEVVRETDAAWILYFEEANEEVCVPKSQVIQGDPESDTEISVPRWLAEKHGIIE